MKFLVFQHVAVEHPGSFRDVLARHGHTMDQVELDEGEPIPPLEGYDALLVMGGPMDVWEEQKFAWLTEEKAAIRRWVSAGRPFLGMCLGEQLLAAAMGGAVGPMTAPPEVGLDKVQILSPDPIFANLPAELPCFQWHGAEVTALPEEAKLLATSAGCKVQAFAVGTHAYGLQFHLELTKDTVAEWGALPEYAAALEKVRGAGAMERLRTEIDAELSQLRITAETVFENFLDIADRLIASRSAA